MTTKIDMQEEISALLAGSLEYRGAEGVNQAELEIEIRLYERALAGDAAAWRECASFVREAYRG